eukprot:1364542-Amphidinium_carterae.1
MSFLPPWHLGIRDTSAEHTGPLKVPGVEFSNKFKVQVRSTTTDTYAANPIAERCLAQLRGGNWALVHFYCNVTCASSPKALAG